MTNAGGVVREFPDRLVPNLFLDGPERDIGLEYYRSFHTWPLTKPDGNYLDNPWVNFSPGPSPHVRAIIKDLNGTVADRWDFSYQTSDPVTEPYVSPRRIVLVEGTDLTITASTITCPMVVVCLEDPNTHAGGHVTIKGDNWYEASDNGQKADSHHSFSVLAQKSLTFDNPSGVPQTLRGFFYSGENKIVVDNPHDVYITGTVQGFPSEGFGFLPFDDPRFEVTADPWLAVYTPPQIPRRPVVVSFR